MKNKSKVSVAGTRKHENLQTERHVASFTDKQVDTLKGNERNGRQEKEGRKEGRKAGRQAGAGR